MSRNQSQTNQPAWVPQPIQQRGDSPKEIAAAINEIKIGLENQRRISDARFMQLHQHLDLKYGINPQRAVACFENSKGDEDVFRRCLQPLPSEDELLEEENRGRIQAPRRKRD